MSVRRRTPAMAPVAAATRRDRRPGRSADGLGRLSGPPRLIGVSLGLVASSVAPTVPDRLHPVAWFGRAMSRVEARAWRDDRVAGVGYAAVGVGLGALGGLSAGSPAAAVSVCAAGRQLRALATDIADRLGEEDLDGARVAVRGLVGRDPSHLDHAGLAAAAIESVAENMVDAVVAPALWATVGGAAGVGVHRAVNTMDAMVGHRSPRYARFGWAAARLDDAMAYVPARLFAVLLALATSTTSGGVTRAARIPSVVRRDAPAHPSPNAGVAEAAMAAAIGCALGGPLAYGDRHEDRPTLGTGPRPTIVELRQAIVLAERTEQLLVALLAGAAITSTLADRRRGRAALGRFRS